MGERERGRELSEGPFVVGQDLSRCIPVKVPQPFVSAKDPSCDGWGEAWAGRGKVKEELTRQRRVGGPIPRLRASRGGAGGRVRSTCGRTKTSAVYLGEPQVM